MDTCEVVIVNCYDGDFSALYINGELAYENHSLSGDKVLEALVEKKASGPITYESFEVTSEEMEKHADSFPKNLSELKLTNE